VSFLNCISPIPTMVDFERPHEFPTMGQRPLIRMRLMDLLGIVRRACKTKDLGLGMLCAEEASHRSPRSLKTVLQTLEPLRLPPPRWLSAAQDAVAAIPRQPPGGHHVYVALLYDPTKSRFGLYVGESFHPPKLRFSQHRSDYNAGRAAKKYGVCLLPSLYERFNPLDRAAAKHLEPRIVRALAKVCDWVEGPRRKAPKQS